VAASKETEGPVVVAPTPTPEPLAEAASANAAAASSVLSLSSSCLVTSSSSAELLCVPLGVKPTGTSGRFFLSVAGWGAVGEETKAMVEVEGGGLVLMGKRAEERRRRAK
jgi:hypothetical protein